MTKSEQARADAMADAETLRLYVERNVSPRRKLSRLVNRASVVTMVFATFNSDQGWAELSARAAFRAVPGLRG